MGRFLKIWDTATGLELRTLKGHTSGQVESVSFSLDGQVIYTDSRYEKLVWNAMTGEQLKNAEWINPTNQQYISPDGRWLVTGEGPDVVLVDLEFKNTQVEKTYRETKVRLDPNWHREQAQIAEQANNWYAALFHWAWVLKSDPDVAATFDSLHHAHQQWLTQFETSQNQSQVDSTNAAPESDPKTVPSSVSPELLLAPVVREMLQLPRGQ